METLVVDSGRARLHSWVTMRFAVFIIMLVTTALVLASWSKEAAACSCGSDWRTFPEDGSIDVPLNVKPTFFEASSDPLPDTLFSLRIAGQLEVTPAPATWQSRERFRDQLVVLEPVEPLAPMTSYEVLAGTSVILRFQTGQQPDVDAPGKTSIKSLSVETMDTTGGTYNSCVGENEGIFGRLRIEYPDLPQDAAYYILQMRSEEGELWTDDWILLSNAREFEPLAISDALCSPRPQVLRKGQSYCATLVAVDLAGNVSASIPELCTIAKECCPDVGLDGVPSESCDSGVNAFGCSVVQGSEQHAVYFLLGLYAPCWRRRTSQDAAGCAANAPAPPG